MLDIINKWNFKQVEHNRYECIISKNQIKEIARDLLSLDTFFTFLSAIDHHEEKKIEIIYAFWNIRMNALFIVKTHVEREEPKIDSIHDIFPGATYSEVEAFDLLGIEFVNNPYLRRGLLVPQELIEKSVFPLRKDSGV